MGGFQNYLHMMYGLPGGFIQAPKEEIGGHWPPLNAKGSAYGKDWTSKRKKKLLALKEQILPDVPVNEFLKAAQNIEVEDGKDILDLPVRGLRVMILSMMMDD